MAGKGVCERGYFHVCNSFVSAMLQGGFFHTEPLRYSRCCAVFAARQSSGVLCLRGLPPL